MNASIAHVPTERERERRERELGVGGVAVVVVRRVSVSEREGGRER